MLYYLFRSLRQREGVDRGTKAPLSNFCINESVVLGGVLMRRDSRGCRLNLKRVEE